jgi:hypothetical protein
MKTSQPKRLFILRILTICVIALTAFACVGTGKIKIDAHVDFPEMGGRRPQAQQSVYLLTNSIASPEMEEAFKKYMASTTPPVNPGIPLKESEVRTRAGFMMSDGRQIWHKCIVTMVETDSSGKATFTGVSAGTYWLYAIKKRPRGQYLMEHRDDS